MTTISERLTPSRCVYLAVCLWTLLAGSACGDEADPMSMMPGATAMSGTGGPGTAGSSAAGTTGTVTAGTPAATGTAGAAGTGTGVGAAGRGSSSGAAGGGTAGRGPTTGAAGGGMAGAVAGGTTGAAGGGTAGAAGAAGGGTAGGGSSNGEYNPCPPAGMPCKVLPFGDSITFGLGATGNVGSYRVELFNKAVMAGKQMTFVGPQANGPMMVAGMPFPRDHEGTSGITIDGISRRVPSPALDEDPNIILIHIGTNDMRGAAATAPMRLAALLDKIIMAKPDALLVVAKIIPLGSSAAVRTYNDAIPAVVEERAMAGKHVILVDQFMGFPTSELADGVHPNDAGYRRMAGVWFEAIKDYLR